MPLYEYCCTECNHKFELLRTIAQADKDVECSQCKGISKRVLSMFASFSKGSNGETTPIAGTSSSCSGCTATNCSSCN